MHQNGRRTSRPAPLPGRRVLSLLVVLSVLAAALPVFASSFPADAATPSLIKLPFASGANWSVLQGYNTSPTDQYGGSHYNCDPATLTDTPSHTQSCGAQYQYKYSIDLVRADGSASGQTVLSPVNGTVRWTDPSTGGISIYMGGNYAFAFFHVNLNTSLKAGDSVTQGQFLGTIAAPGLDNNGGTSHIHVTLWQTTDQGNWSRVAVPFTGSYALDGNDLPDLGSTVHNQYVNRVFVSTNSASSATPTPTATATATSTTTVTTTPSASGVPDAPNQTSPPNGTTYQTNGVKVKFTWSAVSGATQYQLNLDGTNVSGWISGTTWTSDALTDNGQYTWKVQAKNSSGAGAWSPLIVFWVDPPSGGGATPTGTPTTGTLGITLDSASGYVTDDVLVTGKGFQANESVNVYLDATTSTALATGKAGTNGSFYSSITIPDSAGGNHTVIAKGVTSAKQAQAAFKINPSILRDPSTGPAGTSIVITGRGFGAGENVNLSFVSGGGLSNISLGSFTTTAKGVGVVTSSIPQGTNGWHDYSGHGATSGLTAWGAIYVERLLTTSPSSGAAGASVGLTATGFPGSANVTTKWNSSSTLCTGTTLSNGNYSCSFNIPSGTLAGGYPVSLTTAGGTSSSVTVNVTGVAAVSVSSGSGRVGSKITVAVGGFKANTNVTLTWSGADWVTIKTNSGGSFSYPTTVPNGFIGTHTLGARGTSPGGSAIAPTTTFQTSSTGGDTGSRMTSYGTFAVTGTIEGLVGGTTSNGHRITTLDHFVSLPSCTGTSCPGWSTGPATACGNACYVRVTNPATNKCSVAPVYDVGPWFTNDNWWDPAADRKLNALDSNPSYLAQGYPATEANLDGLDVGYGPGISNVGYETGNRAAIDIADGTWVDIGINQDAGIAPVVVTMLWLTGENYQTAMVGCGQSTGTPAITPSATSGIKVGSSLTINGTGFKSGETVSIRFDSATATALATPKASTAGAFTVTITVPVVVNGNHTIYATGGSGSATATARIAIRSSITATSPTKIGVPITVVGTGFKSGESVSIRWGSATAPVVATATATSTGGFSLQATLGAATYGSHYLYATAASGSPWFKVSILPSVTLSATSGGSYSKITVTATGFAANEVVSFNWGTSPPAGSATADSHGSATFLVRTRYGNGTAVGTATGGTSGATATASFTVMQSLAVTPSSGSPGAKITVSGKGWNGDASVTVYFNRTASLSGTTFCTARTNTGGAFSCIGTIPAGTSAGAYVLMAGSRALTASAQLQVTGASASSVATVTLAPTSGQSYSKINVTVTGFGRNETINLNWDSTIWGASSATAGSVITDADGAATFAVRTRNGYGLWTATVTGQTSKRKASATFTVNPSIALSASTGDNGSAITVNGNGWNKDQSVAVTIVASGETVGTALCTATSTSVGKFACTANLPADLKAGVYSIVATMDTLTANASFTATGVAPTNKSASPTPTTTAVASPTGQTTETATPEPQTETATPEPTDVPPTETPTPEPTVAPEPQTSVINPIAAVSVSAPQDPSTPVAAIDPGVELLAGGPNGAVAAISFDVESIGSGTLISAKLVLTGGGDGSGLSTSVSALPGYVVDPSATDLASIPLDQAGQAVSAQGAPAQYASNPGAESALDVTGSIAADGVVTFFITGPPDQILAIAGGASGTPPRLEIVVQPAG